MPRMRATTPEEMERIAERMRERKAALLAGAGKEARRRLSARAHHESHEVLLDLIMKEFRGDDWLVFMKTEARVSLEDLARKADMAADEVDSVLRELREWEVIDYQPIGAWGDSQRVGVSGIRKAVNARWKAFSSRKDPDIEYWYENM